MSAMPPSIAPCRLSPSTRTPSSTAKKGLKRLSAEPRIAPRRWIDAYRKTRPMNIVKSPAAANQTIALPVTGSKPRTAPRSAQPAPRDGRRHEEREERAIVLVARRRAAHDRDVRHGEAEGRGDREEVAAQ
jgi:hypothetical protein